MQPCGGSSVDADTPALASVPRRETRRGSSMDNNTKPKEGTYYAVKLMVHLHRGHVFTAAFVAGRDSYISFFEACFESFVLWKGKDAH